MGRSRDLADILGKTEVLNTSNETLLTNASGVDSAYVTANTTPALSFFNTLDSLPVTSLTSGQQAYVSANNRLYISDGSGWYNKALITLSPTMTLDPTGAITLATDGATASTVTIVAVDSDTPGSGLTYSVESDGNMLGRAVISQDSSVFTIRPLSSDSGATDGTFTLTFKTSDGVNLATDSADFSLTFISTVDSSSSTVLLMKGRLNALDNSAITYRNSSDALTGFTEAGDVTASTFNPYRSGGYSIHMDGTGDKLSISSSSDFAYGTGDFTWEAWIYVPEAKSNHYLLDHGSNGGIMNIANTKVRYYNTTVGTGSALYTTGGTITYNTWHHVAFVRASGTTTIYIDGVVGSSGSDTHNYGSQAITIGNYGGGGSYYYQGFIRDLRLVKGTAVYTSAFTPPTEGLTAISGTSLLVGHAPYIGDGSSTGHSISLSSIGDTHTKPFGPYDYSVWSLTDHGNSVYFDGTGDYITPNAVTAPGTGAVTYEAWVRQENGGSANHTIFDASTNGFGGGNGITVQISSNSIQWVTSDGITTSASKQFQDEVWHHVAFVRDASNNLQYYVDGVGHLTGQTYNGNTSSTSLRIGATNAGTPSNLFQGHIANARVTNAQVYSSNFTPPTAPLTGISNTQLVMYNGQDANVYDAAAGNTLLLINDTQSSTTQRKFTTSSSIYFDGTGDAIDIPGAQELLTFYTGDFTIECWFRPSVVNINTAIMDFRPNSTTGSYPFIQPLNTDLKFKNVSSGDLIASGVLAANTWIHIAVVRSNGTTTLYTDGVSRDTGADTTNYSCRSVPNIGKHNYAGSNLNGYLQDLRISKGYARYTANFTPPTAEFEL